MVDNVFTLTEITFPMTTESTNSGLTPAALNTALLATVCRFVAVVFRSEPPNVPKAVRLAPTMKTP